MVFCSCPVPDLNCLHIEWLSANLARVRSFFHNLLDCGGIHYEEEGSLYRSLGYTEVDGFLT